MIGECEIRHRADVITAQITARRTAAIVGFGRREREEFAIAASELATNILKHGVRGRMRFEVVHDPDRGDGLQVVAYDEGPPFRDFALATRDGCDDGGPIGPDRVPGRGGLGIGLGAVQRLMDSVSWRMRPNGKEILALRFPSKGR